PRLPPLPAKNTAPARPGSKHVKRREKSGIPALDRFLADQPDETDNTEREDDEDDDWDFIDAVDGEDRNGPRGPSLFARGVVDRYRLAVFRKSSTPNQRNNNQSRSVSGVSKASEASLNDAPSPKNERRGRTPGLPFRKNPKQFLPKSPPSSYSPKAASKSALKNGQSATTPTASTAGGDTLPPSLKSKQSAISMGARSQSSGQSNDVELGAEEPEKGKTKKLKRYKENAEKVFSLFSSPRQQQAS
ncbi:hypothetical protein AX16_008616, partial [Volvariella volvacea WC 439]